MGVCLFKRGYECVPFAYTGYKFIEVVPRVRRGYITVSTISVVLPQ